MLFLFCFAFCIDVLEELVTDIWSGYLVHHGAVFEESPWKISFGVCVMGAAVMGAQQNCRGILGILDLRHKICR